MMNANEKLMQGVMLRFFDYVGGVSQMAPIIRQLEVTARDLVEEATEFVLSQQGGCAAEEDLRQLFRGIALRSGWPEQNHSQLEILLDMLLQQAMAQMSRDDHAAHGRNPRLDPGGSPLLPDDRDLDDPW